MPRTKTVKTTPSTVRRTRVAKPVIQLAAKTPSVVPPTTQPGQRGENIPPYFFRFIPSWNTPSWFEAKRWRNLVRNQPVAMICKENLQSTIAAMDWRIMPRDTTQLDELKSEIDYYTRLFEDDGSFDFPERIEWLVQDFLDLPFGGAAEVGREGDDPTGKALWIIPLDGGTLFPTLNDKWPVGQYVPGFAVLDPIYFPRHGINRLYTSPRTEIDRAGWGMAPPEKIYLALEMLWRGDQYYANMLLDTPEAGILDLGDMDKAAAEEWALSYKALLSGVDPFKIPILYEHEKPVAFIPFHQPPSDIIFDRISLKYAAFIAAGYGLSLGDIGLSQAGGSGGETLAGSIRDERKSRRSGRALILRKLRLWHNRILPSSLQFTWMDQDEEVSQGVGRARLSNAQGLDMMCKGGIISPQEARSQAIADNIINIPIPEALPEDAKPVAPVAPFGGGNQNPNIVDQLERPVSPDLGGHGDIKKRTTANELSAILLPMWEKTPAAMSDARMRRMIRRAVSALLPTMRRAVTLSTDEELQIEQAWFDRVLDEQESDIEGYVARTLDTVSISVCRSAEDKGWGVLTPDESEYQGMLKVYSVWFGTSARGLLRRLTDYLYENDYIDREESPKFLDPTDAAIALILLGRAKEMIVEVNRASQNILTRILTSSVRSALLSAEMADALRQGVDIETIMSNNAFVSAVMQTARTKLMSDLYRRLDFINQYEHLWTSNRAALEQLSAVGLEKKRWDHFGSDIPCEKYCQPAIDAGEVHLSYKYETAFGPSESGPGHPECHCGVNFVPSEVQRHILAGTFPIQNWRGV